jgi:hypothetical protein
VNQTSITSSQGIITSIDNINDLENNLRRLENQGPQIAQMNISGLGTLTFGVSKNLGFIEFMTENQEPPYLYANNSLINFIGEFADFDSGGTSTPIPKNQCIPFDLVRRILIDSFLSGKLPNYINWYEE